MVNAFRVFSSRNYNYFFWGQLISRMGTWMQRTAVLWVVYMMTHSMLMVGVATFAEQFPSFIFSPLGGVTADKYDRNRVVIVTQIVSAIQAALLTIVYYMGLHYIWLILLLSVVLGIANAFDIPARQAMVNELISNDEMLPSAIAMNSALNNLTRLVGPALAGILLAKYNATVCFAANACSFIAVIYCLFMLKIPQLVRIKKSKNPWFDFKECIHYTKKNTDIGITLLFCALISLFVATYNTLQPYFAHDIFKGDASTYGFINAATGFGALISILVIASQKNGNRLKHLLLFNLILLGLGLMVMSHVKILSFYLVMSMICGFGTMSFLPICNTVIQTASSSEMRGRVIGLFAMATLGMLPLGSLFIGWMAKIVGPKYCQFGQGVVCLLIAVAFSRFLIGRKNYSNRNKEL